MKFSVVWSANCNLNTTVRFSSWTDTLPRLRNFLTTVSNSCNHNYSNFLSVLRICYYLFRNSYTIMGVSKIPVLRTN